MDEQDHKITEYLKHACAGDGSALGILLQQLRPWLLEIARKQLDPKLRTRLDESDLVQQTCLSIHRKMVRFEGASPAQFMAWIKLVHENNIRNAARDQLQRKKRAAGREQFVEDLQIEASELSPGQQMDNLSEVTELMAHLELLPEHERQALQLRYFERLKMRELADRLGVTKDAAVWLIQCGLKRLRQQMNTFESSTDL